MTTTVCPQPDKKRYATREAAHDAAIRSELALGFPLYPYVCICTWIHLSKTPTEDIPAGAHPEPADIDRLTRMTSTEFRELVSNECRGKTPMPDRLALRHPDHTDRWARALRELQHDIDQQLHARPDDQTPTTRDWRRRAEAFRDGLTLRLRECDAIRTQARRGAQQAKEQREQATKQARIDARNASLDQRLDSHGVPRTSANELRRQAGEKAINRLIDAHGLEFSRYLAEECAAIGAPLPNRLRKYLTDPPTDLAQTA